MFLSSIRGLGLAGILALSVAAAPLSAQPGVTSPTAAYGFTVNWPQAPQMQQLQIPGSTENLTQFVAASPSGLFIAQTLKTSPPIQPGQEKQFFAMFPQGYVTGMKGKLLNQQDITLGTYQGVEFTGQMPQGARFKARAFLVNDKLYIVLVGPPLGQLDPGPAGDQFLNSFQVTTGVPVGNVPRVNLSK